MNTELLNELEEQALDGDVSAARKLFDYYRDTDPTKADYWKSMAGITEDIHETPEPAEPVVLQEEWYEDYKTGKTALYRIQELNEEIQRGNPFPHLILAEDPYTAASDIIGKISHYEQAIPLLEQNIQTVGYREVLLKTLMKAGDLCRQAADGPESEYAGKAFKYLVNAAELDGSVPEVNSRIIEFYETGFGCEKDPEKAFEYRVKNAENEGVPEYLKIACEYQKKKDRLQAADYLQRAYLLEDEAYPEENAVVLYKLAANHLPAGKGIVPELKEAVQGLIHVDTEKLDQYLTDEEKKKLPEVLEPAMAADDSAVDFLMYAAGQVTKDEVEDINEKALAIYEKQESVPDSIDMEKVRQYKKPGEQICCLARQIADEHSIERQKKAVALYNRADELGSCEAPKILYSAYMAPVTRHPNFILIEKDDQKASEYMFRGADRGNPILQSQAGEECLREKNIEKGERYLQLASENGDEYALERLGMFFAQDGDNQDLEKAEKYLTEAENRGDHSVGYSLATVLLKKTDSDKEQIKKYLRNYMAQVIRANKDALFRLGELCFETRQNPDDAAEAYQMLSKAYDAKSSDPDLSAKTAYYLGRCFEEGVGISKDETAAFRYYGEAAGLGHSESAVRHAMMLAEGRGCQKNSTKALQELTELRKKGTDCSKEIKTVEKAVAAEARQKRREEKKQGNRRRQIPFIVKLLGVAILYLMLTHWYYVPLFFRRFSSPPAPRPTVTPELTVETATPDPGIGEVTVLIDNLRVRQWASLKAPQVGYAVQNVTYVVFGVHESDGYTWYCIGNEQYIASREGEWTEYIEY